MLYRIVVEEFKPIDDDLCEIRTLSDKTVTLDAALKKLRRFALDHPGGHLANGGFHLVEYETEDVELSCWIDYADE